MPSLTNIKVHNKCIAEIRAEKILNVFGGTQESACLSVCLSVCLSSFCQDAGGGIRSHLVTALVHHALYIIQHVLFVVSTSNYEK